MKRVALAIIAILLPLLGASDAGASARPFVYHGAGFTLTLRTHNVWYGTGARGMFSSARKHFHIEADWIPAGDAGGDLLRFYGHPFPGNHLMGLVGLATLYSACIPDCATSRQYLLTPIKPYGIPGHTGNQPIHLVQQR